MFFYQLFFSAVCEIVPAVEFGRYEFRRDVSTEDLGAIYVQVEYICFDGYSFVADHTISLLECSYGNGWPESANHPTCKKGLNKYFELSFL